MSGSKRRRITLEERMMPCECCGHPLSQLHHQLPIEYYQDNDKTRHLCANCHELFHLMERAWEDLRNTSKVMTYNRKLYAHVVAQIGIDDPRIKKIQAMINESAMLKVSNEPEKLEPFLRALFSGFWRKPR